MSEQTRAIDLTRLEAGAINRSSGDRIPNSFRPAPVRLLQLGARDQAGEGDWREYEQPLPEVLIALAQKLPGAFYDVGANSGFYAILLGRLGLARKIVCVEAMPPIAEVCRRNLALNWVGASVAEVALSDSAGTATLYVPSDHHRVLETSCSLDEEFKPEGSEPLEVPTLTLDALHAQRGHEPVGLVKIDVEGAEHLVLAGADELIRRERPVLTVEVLPRAPFARIDSFLAEHGYSLVPLFRSGPGAPTKSAAFAEGAWNQAAIPDERLPQLLPVIVDAAAAADRVVANLDPDVAVAIELEALHTEREALRRELEENDERRRAMLAEAALEELRAHLLDVQAYVEELRVKEQQLAELRAHHAELEPYVRGLEAQLAAGHQATGTPDASQQRGLTRRLRAAIGSDKS